MQLEGPSSAGLMYSDTGGDGPAVVLLHGVLMGGSLWDSVVNKQTLAFHIEEFLARHTPA